MKSTSSNVALTIAVVVFFYFLSPIWIASLIQASPWKNSPALEEGLGLAYSPCEFLYNHCPPYKTYIDYQLAWLRP